MVILEIMYVNVFKSVLLHPRALVFALALLPAISAFAFDFNDVAKRAQQLSKSAWKEKQVKLPKSLAELDYDAYRDIRYKPEKAYWRAQKLPFELSFMHQVRQYAQPVKINEIVAKRVRPIAFDPRNFDYGKNEVSLSEMRSMGFAGFRVHYPLNSAKSKDEVLVFQGASYLRSVGKQQSYGISARGLAVDTALNSGEEFPRFTEFWI